MVDKNAKSDRKSFLNKHLIPDVDLSIDNFDQFFEERKIILIKKLSDLLS
ncbi:hypothetical protein HMPREF9095_1911 [Haemophilus aegyptius ATCC 11116]|nr:hypothetical protein HMPREF9095_1911 [Haemophilus aegyptius ATCC 11116]